MLPHGQGTHKTKNRGEVSGAGRKPFKQKGTGNARQGSIRAPHMTGGGVVHGPTPRNYAQRTPKKMIAAALRGALSDRARHDRIHVVENFISGEIPSTKAAKAAFAELTDRKNVLFVIDRAEDVLALSARNLQKVLHHVDAVVTSAVRESATQCCGDHLLGGALC